ncbi:SDR family oxidoreductase [Actinokineospora pegani]|uniref:SDR family oxidoreductase n=1 Tax=Actinokineospora pegani TaxID=2654637 RepID=UPI0012EACCF2|nr:SDR family oxidoreductase [Actinokineospora pegani]
MKYLVTGATGHLGGRVVKHLLDRVPAADLIVSVRDPQRAEDLAALGVEVRQGDFGTGVDFSGADVLLLISTDTGDRVTAHRKAIEAARTAGVSRIAYTSVTDADTSPAGLAADHKATEEAVRATGIPFTFLRNGMYHENYLPTSPTTATGEGRIASASRDDLAEAAAIALTGQGHENKTYELTGPTAWSFTELNNLVGQTHHPVTAAERKAAFEGSGLPPEVATLLVDIEVNIAAGTFDKVHRDLEDLLGRTPKTIEEAVREL